MTIQELLQSKGFTEGVDYTLDGGVLTPIEKTHTITTQVTEPEYNEFGEEVTPATYSHTEETYTEEIPSLDSLKLELIKAADIVLLVDKYLSDKQELREEDDSFNTELLFGGGWRFKNIPAPSISELFDLIGAVKSAQDQERINSEALSYLASTDWMIIREMDGGAACPDEVKAERAAARARIVR